MVCLPISFRNGQRDRPCYAKLSTIITSLPLSTPGAMVVDANFATFQASPMARMLRSDALFAFDLLLRWTNEGQEFDLQRLLVEARCVSYSSSRAASAPGKLAYEDAEQWFLGDRGHYSVQNSTATASHASSQRVMVSWIEQWLRGYISAFQESGTFPFGSNAGMELPELLSSLRSASTESSRWVHGCVCAAARQAASERAAAALQDSESGLDALQACMSWIPSTLIPCAIPLLLSLEELNSEVGGRGGGQSHVQLLHLPSGTCTVAIYAPASMDSCYSMDESRQNAPYDGGPSALAPGGRIMDILDHCRRATAAALARNRLSSPFDLVRDYPDSLPLLSEAAAALALCSNAECQGIKASFVAQLSEALRARLLHPGVATASIVDVYLSLIRTCAAIDPSGIIGTLAAEPVRVYLRCRPDCIRVIIASATEDEGSALHQELQGQTGKLLVGTDSGDSEDAVHSSPSQPGGGVVVPDAVALLPAALAQVLSPLHVQRIMADVQTYPLPVSSVLATTKAPADPLPPLWSPGRRQDHTVLRALHGKHVSGLQQGQAGVDLLASLVDIFGSADAFVAEYRSLLAERLLSRGQEQGWDLTWEERVMELLKLRFGDASLSTAEVMLKDVVDSKRATAGIGQLTRTAKLELLHTGRLTEHPALRLILDTDLRPAEMLVLSSHYWQGLPGAREAVVLHPSVQALVDVLTAGYAEVRKPRKAVLFPTLGVIEVEVLLPTLSGEMLSVTAKGTAAQVSVLCYMDGKASMPLVDLCGMMSVHEHAGMRLVQHWAAQHILALSRQDGLTTVWVAACMPQTGDGQLYAQRDATETVGGSDHPEAVAMWRSYVSGLLSNLGPQALDRIHGTLKMFASMGDYPYEKQPAETARFLADLVRQEFLELSDGIYKLRA